MIDSAVPQAFKSRSDVCNYSFYLTPFNQLLSTEYQRMNVGPTIFQDNEMTFTPLAIDKFKFVRSKIESVDNVGMIEAPQEVPFSLDRFVRKWVCGIC